MSLADHYRPGQIGLSFELFPPKTAEQFQTLYDNVRRLMEFKPHYFTCTYGAAGSSQKATLEVLENVKRLTGCPVASHLTCVGLTVDQLRDYLNEARQRGADYIVALRGDPPKGTTAFQSVSGGLSYANELVGLIRSEFEFGIAVAGYPEVHQEALSAESDLCYLKLKVDSGADIVITQLFYDNEDFYRFRDRCDKLGIRVPIIPGILPVTNFAQAQRIASLCKARIPEAFAAAITADDSPEHQFRVGVEHARQQTLDLIRHGVPGIHYYVLNKSNAAEEMLRDVDAFG